MLYAFGFEQIGVVVGDLYFLDPHPAKGQEGAEHGVRLELRMLERGALRGSIYSAQPIEVGRPIWRVDLLETVAGQPGSFDRTHHHPKFTGWGPSRRVFDAELTTNPLGWLGGRLADLAGVLATADLPAETAGPDDAEHLREAAPEIVDVTRRLLEKVRSGELGNPPANAVAQAHPASGTAPSHPAGEAAPSQPAGEAARGWPLGGTAAGQPAGGAVPAAPALIRSGWL